MRTNTQEAVLSAYVALVFFALRPRSRGPRRAARALCARKPENARRGKLSRMPTNFAGSQPRSVV